MSDKILFNVEISVKSFYDILLKNLTAELRNK